MENNWLLLITTLSDLGGAGLALWLGIYLLARGRSNKLAFRAVIMLFALAFYFCTLFLLIYEPEPTIAAWQTFAIAVAVTAAQNLTYHLLPSEFQPRQRWISRTILLFGLVTMVILLTDLPNQTVQTDKILFITPVEISTTAVIYGIFQTLASLSIINNLRLIVTSGQGTQNKAFYAAVAFGASSVGYGLISTISGIPLPRFIANLLLLCALALLSYSIARYQALIERRVGIHDLPGTALTVFVLSALYVLAALLLDLPPTSIILVAVLATFTHATYDLIRELLDRSFHSQESELRRQLRHIRRDVSPGLDFARSLDRGLAILFHNLQASSGFIGVSQGDGYVVEASIQSIQLSRVLDAKDVTIAELTSDTGRLAPQIAYLAPVYGGGRQLGVIGIGPRKGQRAYTDRDLEWLEDVADSIGTILFTYQQELIPVSDGFTQEFSGIPQENIMRDSQPEKTLKIAQEVDENVYELVEDGFRNLNDVSHLGDSQLLNCLNVQGETHIERGRAVRDILLEILETLRPDGKRPSKNLTPDWFRYIILKDAYLLEKQNNDIMANLNISEKNFYRKRRRALKGIARAIMERELVQAAP